MSAQDGATTTPGLTTRPQWRALQAHREQIGARHLREFFADDPARGERLRAEAAGLYFDYSKQRVTDETLRLLIELANACGVTQRIGAMFSGVHINTTEDRAVLHVALRAPAGERIEVDGKDVVPDVRSSIAWLHFPNRCAAARGSATPASACAT